MRQEAVDETASCIREALAFPTPEKGAIRPLASVRAQRRFLMASAISVFSQEKPPSASGLRPKWP